MEVKIKRYKSGKNAGSIRKNEVKIDYHDSWSADWTIATIVAPLLVQLQETKHGAPCVADEDVPEELRSTSCAPKENVWDTDENYFKRWDYVLQEMIFAMQEISNHNENEPEMFRHVGDMVTEENSDGTYTMVSSDFEIIPEMKEPNRQYHARIQRGCVLFGKYFMSLWD